MNGKAVLRSTRLYSHPPIQGKAARAASTALYRHMNSASS